MSQLPEPGLGARVAYYRRLNGWSAERLAQEAGEGVTRAILAQLESGRRDSLSLAQFCAIALALGLPPAALLADPFHPSRRVERPASLGGDGQASMPVGKLISWAAGFAGAQSDLPSALKWDRVIDGLWRYYLTSDELLERLFGGTDVDRTADEWVQAAWNIGRARRRNEESLLAEGVDFEAES